MRILGLDIGDKTVGVAVSDPLLISAQGVTTIERVGIRKDTGKVLEYIKEYNCDGVVAGLPLMLSGEDSPQTAKVREFVEMLNNKMHSNGIKYDVVFMDERFTTKIAENVLIEADLSRAKRGKIIDRQAAIIILQSYLDANREKLKNSGI